MMPWFGLTPTLSACGRAPQIGRRVSPDNHVSDVHSVGFWFLLVNYFVDNFEAMSTMTPPLVARHRRASPQPTGIIERYFSG
jgi:hypothetical protein